VTFHELRRGVMEKGSRTFPPETLDEMAERSERQLAGLPRGCLRFINPHRYKVSISGGLNELRNRLIETVRSERA
jgi:nicotinate phosphoribosyltransferase